MLRGKRFFTVKNLARIFRVVSAVGKISKVGIGLFALAASSACGMVLRFKV
jgi:hypothetical protein